MGPHRVRQVGLAHARPNYIYTPLLYHIKQNFMAEELDSMESAAF